MENNYIVEISTSFNTMLYKNLFTYTLYSPSYANFIHSKIYHFLELLKIFPHSFSAFYLNDANINLRRFVIGGKFLIIYEIKNNIVRILYFVDGRRSFENYLLY